MSTKEVVHKPVLLQEVLSFLDPKPNLTYVDATFGGGGYTKAILEKTECNVIAIDRDEDALERAKPFSEEYKDRFQFFLSNFSNLDVVLKDKAFDGIVFDFGVSSFQIENGERGFSFKMDGNLDMRMSKNGELTAEDVVNTYTETELEKIIKFYGEEPFAKKIARAIINYRKFCYIKTTLQLAEIVRSIVPKFGMLDPATKTFQALRIFVNDELREIKIALDKIVDMFLSFGTTSGKIQVLTVAFHSLEDRTVKNWIKTNKEFFRGNDKYRFENKTGSVVEPSRDERIKNPRSRSAKLRYVEIFNDNLNSLV